MYFVKFYASNSHSYSNTSTFLKFLIINLIYYSNFHWKIVLGIPMKEQLSNNIISTHHLPNLYSSSIKIIYSNGKNEDTLPDCGPQSVCNKVDIYDKPWIEKQCKCKGSSSCSTSLMSDDGFTIIDRTRYYKLCKPVQMLGKCRYFRDITWTMVTKGENLTHHIVHCQCPKDSIPYLIKSQAYRIDENEIGFKYSFACSPQTKQYCQRKEPCRLFSIKRRSSVTDVNTSTLCHCPSDWKCPKHHLDSGVIPGKFHTETLVKTFSAYCVQ